jgi:hypothetical protein
VRLADVAKRQKGDYWVTQRYYDYVTGPRNLEKERDALQIIMTRPPRVRINTYSASGAGRCLRERQLAYIGAKKLLIDERSANIFANGDYVHLRHQVAGLINGYITQAEVPVRNDQYNLTGTMDGLLSNGEGLEIKSINTRGFEEISSFGPKHDHRFQIHSYMLAADLEAFHLVYENKNDQRIKEFLVTRDEATIAKVIEELEQLQAAEEAHALLPMLPDCVIQTGSTYSWCQYKKSCPVAKFTSPGERKPPIQIRSSTHSG